MGRLIFPLVLLALGSFAPADLALGVGLSGALLLALRSPSRRWWRATL